MEERIKSTFIVDASFILAFLLQENNSKVDKILNQYKDEKINLISTMLLKYEVGNGLRTAVLRKRINMIQAQALYQAFLELDIIEEKVNYPQVFKLALSKKVTFYDASYLYLACYNRLRLLSFDKRLK